MRELKVDMKRGYGDLKINSKEYSVLRADNMWNLMCKDYSQKYLITTFIVENKKRFSTVQKYAEQYGIVVVEA